LVGGALDLHHHGHHGTVVGEHDHSVGAVLRGRHLGALGGDQRRLAVFGNADAEHLVQQFRRQMRTIMKKLNENLMLARNHSRNINENAMPRYGEIQDFTETSEHAARNHRKYSPESVYAAISADKENKHWSRRPVAASERLRDGIAGRPPRYTRKVPPQREKGTTADIQPSSPARRPGGDA